MRWTPNTPPRAYRCGARQQVTIADCGRLALEPNEQITLTTAAGGEYDVARKSWGFYATPSINGRLASFGLRTALTRNSQGRYFVMLVEAGKEDEFAAYLADDQIEMVAWLDDDTLSRVATTLVTPRKAP